MGYPAAIELAIWLNQVRNGNISATDAQNAAETISESTLTNWAGVIDQAKQSSLPCFALLPIPGWSQGLSAETLKQIDAAEGVCVVGGNMILAKSKNPLNSWLQIEVPSQINPPEPKAARLHFQELLDESVTELAKLDLTGERSIVEAQLAALKPSHLPPALASRVKTDLDLAQRIWVITALGIERAQAVHSRSLDELKLTWLRQLQISAINLMSAITLAA